MARPKLEIGTFGELSASQRLSGRWQAETRYRDLDGVTRPVRANGATSAQAKAALRSKLKDQAEAERRQRGADAGVHCDRDVRAVGAAIAC